MNTRTAYSTALIVGTFVLATLQNVQAQTAEDILNKAAAIYSSAATYQATYHWEKKTTQNTTDKKGKLEFLESAMVEVKMIGMTKLALHVTDDKPRGHKQNYLHTGSWDVIDDGQDYYFNSANDNNCYRRAHDKSRFTAEDATSIWYMLTPQVKPRDGFSYSLQGAATIQGRAVYVIEARGIVKYGIDGPAICVPEIVNGQLMNKMMYPSKRAWSIEEVLTIDKATFRLVQRKVKSIGVFSTTTILQTIKNEVFDVPLPASTFFFEVPTRATTQRHQEAFNAKEASNIK